MCLGKYNSKHKKNIKSTYCYKIDARVRCAEGISDINPNDAQCSVKSEKLEKEREEEVCVRVCVCVGMCVIKVRVKRRCIRIWNEFSCFYESVSV